jgi:rhamnogalacturonyl hydrolase YesR/predicted dehydrogenase
LAPFHLGLIGEKSHQTFYANALKKIPFLSVSVIEQYQAKTVDAIIIATPLAKRAELTKRLLQTGCHVLVEAPIATSYQEFDAIMLAANQQNKRLAVASFHRFLPSVVQARSLIDELGKISAIYIQVNQKNTEPLLARHQEGFVSQALPLFDLVRWLCAKNPHRLYTQKNLLAQFSKPTKNLHLLVELGTIPVLYATVPVFEMDNHWVITIHGRKRHLRLISDGKLQYFEVTGQWKTLRKGYSDDYQIAVRDFLIDFVQSCQTGKEPEVNVLDGMAQLALTLAAVKSAQSGQAISMIEQPYDKDHHFLWWKKYQQSKKEKSVQPANNQSQISSNLSIPLPPISFWKRAIILERMNSSALKFADRVAQRLMVRHEYYPSYTTDLALEGLLYLFDASGDEQYLNYLLKVWQFREENNAVALDWKTLFVCLHFEMFIRIGDTKYIDRFITVAQDFRDNVPRDIDGAVAMWINPEQQRIFVDMLQGYAIFMARAGWLSGDDSYFDECVNQYQKFRHILRNPSTGLWHQGRGWDSNLQQISPGHWNRGQGWVLRGMVESLCYLPENHAKTTILWQMLLEFADSLIKYQDSRGLWHQLTDNPASYPETSGTAMLIHYFYRAIYQGWLSKTTYLPVVEKALNALLGFIHQDGLVSNTSHASGPLMTLEGYLHRPSVSGDPHSIGTTLMACAAPYLTGF